MNAKVMGSQRLKGNDNGLFDRMHKFIDENHRVLKLVLYGVGGVGIFLIARNAYLFRTFNHVSEIPEQFIQTQVRLQGQVQSVGEDSVLYIQHIPVFSQPKLPFVKPPSCLPLPVNLAFLEASPGGHDWLVENALDQRVWFHLLYRADDGRGPVLYSKVELPKTMKHIQVNEELVHRGLCRVTALGGFDKPRSIIPKDDKLTKLMDTLIAIETKASNKGKGMWWDEEFERRKQWRTRGINLVKTVVLAPYKGVAWIYGRIKPKKV